MAGVHFSILLSKILNNSNMEYVFNYKIYHFKFNLSRELKYNFLIQGLLEYVILYSLRPPSVVYDNLKKSFHLKERIMLNLLDNFIQFSYL